MRTTLILSGVLLAVLAQGCDEEPTRSVAGAQPSVDLSGASSPPGVSPGDVARAHPTFETFWYRGLAELSRYELRQMRYGSEHPGEAVLVFVTEDFRTDRHVKYEGGPRDNVISVLKLNASRRFYTGIYPYSVLTSSFTPVSEPGLAALKVSTSVQEWCGHVYLQLERDDSGLAMVSHSYFQGEEDREGRLPPAGLEDALWARVRRDPGSLPVGPQRLVPALTFLRFEHRDVESADAVLSRDTVEDARFGDGTFGRYRVEYPALGRTLVIYYELDFPYGIVGFEERFRRGDRDEVTTAIRTHVLMTDYWNHHDPDDAPWRQALGLHE